LITRRRFLAYSALGGVTAAQGSPAAGAHPLPSRADGNAAGLVSLENKIRLARLKDFLLGYPINMNMPPRGFFAWRTRLQQAGIDMFSYNNLGNPFHESTIPFNTHDLEQETIQRFGTLLRFPTVDTWGFLSHSGTDSNMHGMYMGRTILKGRTGKMPRCYFTDEAHYSIQILQDLLGLEAVAVATHPDGSMDADDLEGKLRQHRDTPALVVATLGTTFKGAIDPVDEIRSALETSKNGESYLHVDAALFGGYLPHTDQAHLVHCMASGGAGLRYDSLAISCHKFFGFPSPAGLFITTKSHFDAFLPFYSRVHNPEYVGQVPGTITCSRDAVKPAEFAYFATPEAMARQAEDAHAILERTDFLMAQMQDQLEHLAPRRASRLSNTIYFRKPADWVVKKYSLATMHIGKVMHAHAIIMPHANKGILTEFLHDLKQGIANTPTPA
jgi:histidine decarboxylase